MKRKIESVVVGQHVALKALFTGKTLPPRLVGVFPSGAIETYADVEDAAKRCASREVATSLPLEEGWDGMREMPPLMKLKFEKLLAEARAALPARKRSPKK